MEFSLSFTTTSIATILGFLIFLYLLLWNSKSAKTKSFNKTPPPQAGGAWPVIGHLHLLSGSQLPHVTLGSMADKYGPIFTIKFGVHKALVVSDSKIAKECFTTNDKAFANRPKSVAVELMGYNYAMFGLGPYGPYWRQMRKMVMHELLSDLRQQMFGPTRVAEVKASIREIYDIWLNKKGEASMVKIEMKKWLGKLTLNMVVKMLVGKRFCSDDEQGGRSLKAIRRFIELVGAFVVSDAIPFLRWLDLGGYHKEMKKTAKEIDCIFEGWLEEHKSNRDSGQVKADQEDFMYVMLSTLQGTSPKDFGGFNADTIIKSTCLALLTGATDTTMVILTWALTLLLNNPDVLKKAQEEMDIQVGRERQVDESDINKLFYLQATIKESMRLHPAGQLLAPHESMEDCIVGCYNIPKGTRLVVNLSRIHRDPKVWRDPCEFRPERFLTSHKDINVRGQDFELMPFGSGRRMCPGVSLGLQVVQLTLASLIQGFYFFRPSHDRIDMSEGFGLSNLKATPLDVLLKPRLSSYK